MPTIGSSSKSPCRNFAATSRRLPRKISVVDFYCEQFLPSQP
jgi:hypothetical protein